METFLYKDLKKASREKDKSRIMTLGPYAFALSFILTNTKYNIKELFVYRGMRMPVGVFIDLFCKSDDF